MFIVGLAEVKPGLHPHMSCAARLLPHMAMSASAKWDGRGLEPLFCNLQHFDHASFPQGLPHWAVPGHHKHLPTHTQHCRTLSIFRGWKGTTNEFKQQVKLWIVSFHNIKTSKAGTLLTHLKMKSSRSSTWPCPVCKPCYRKLAANLKV